MRTTATEPRALGIAPGVFLRWMLAVVAAMVVGGFFTGMFVPSRYEARLGQMARETAAARQRFADLLRDPATRIDPLRGSIAAEGRIVWHPQTAGFLLIRRLPPAPSGRAYAAWTISAGRAKLAGLLQVDPAGNVIHPLPPGAVDAVTVTLEPTSAPRTPSGPTVLTSGE
jgi:hypothetical protein